MSDRIPPIPVDPPTSDARRDRVERALFAQLQTLRMADRVDAVVPAAKPRRAWLFAGMGALAATTIAVVIFAIRPAAEVVAEHADTPSRVVTPVGGTSQFTVGDAVIIATSDTNVEVKRGGDGGTTLVVARGSVDCDVPPRGNRPPFHVIAGEVSVEVVGTRFTVTRTPTARVDVARGKVRVKAPGGTWLVGAGESWTPQITALRIEEPARIEPPVIDPIDPIELDQTAPAPPTTQAPPTHVVVPSPHAAYQAAVRLASTDPATAAKAYRAVANGKGADAALALMDLASLVEKTDRNAALSACDEYLRRFAHGANVEDVTWLRIDLLRTAGRRDEARAAAVEYLRQFPNGTFAGDAARMRD